VYAGGTNGNSMLQTTENSIDFDATRKSIIIGGTGNNDSVLEYSNLKSNRSHKPKLLKSIRKVPSVPLLNKAKY